MAVASWWCPFGLLLVVRGFLLVSSWSLGWSPSRFSLLQAVCGWPPMPSQSPRDRGGPGRSALRGDRLNPEPYPRRQKRPCHQVLQNPKPNLSAGLVTGPLSDARSLSEEDKQSTCILPPVHTLGQPLGIRKTKLLNTLNESSRLSTASNTEIQQGHLRARELED